MKTPKQQQQRHKTNCAEINSTSQGNSRQMCTGITILILHGKFLKSFLVDRVSEFINNDDTTCILFQLLETPNCNVCSDDFDVSTSVLIYHNLSNTEFHQPLEVYLWGSFYIFFSLHSHLQASSIFLHQIHSFTFPRI